MEYESIYETQVDDIFRVFEPLALIHTISKRRLSYILSIPFFSLYISPLFTGVVLVQIPFKDIYSKQRLSFFKRYQRWHPYQYYSKDLECLGNNLYGRTRETELSQNYYHHIKLRCIHKFDKSYSQTRDYTGKKMRYDSY